MSFLRACPLAAGAAPVGCDWCGRLLSGRQTRWCSPDCIQLFKVNHVWSVARVAALRRDRYRCVRAGCRTPTDRVEVNHRSPLDGLPRTQSCLHHLAGLEVLCRQHHRETTMLQRRAGLIGRRRR